MIVASVTTITSHPCATFRIRHLPPRAASSTWSQLTDLVDEGVLTARAHAEVVVQSLALLLVPRVPADLPLGFFAVPCASLLERLRTPLSVRICVALLTARISDANLTADAVLCPLAKRLRAVLSDPKDRERRLLMQCADFLPSDLLGTVVITLPRCLTHSKLIDVAALNERSVLCAFDPTSPQR
ncbi:unnamed protein product [Taenia asiatica]|uniref:Rho-GAP domain-containing protein n=1 Tax=Taenia asiatica TaxID=60517 RepID=A0A0R3WH63_TAEAS|nr:unnamed protein product [Taenia asiatica]